MGHTAGVAGLEPANAGVKVPCLTTWRHPIAGCPPHDAADLGQACLTIKRRKGRIVGLEPTTSRATIWRSTTELYPPQSAIPRFAACAGYARRLQAIVFASRTCVRPHIGLYLSCGQLQASHGDSFQSHMHGGLSSPKSARLEGLEPPTHGLEGRCSIQLSYRRRPETRQSILRTSC